ncbi:MAG: L-2-hydroxyglutarate oxidase [Bacillota bacterium]
MRDGCEILIIGGGIIGLSIARELLRRGAEDILLIEKEGAPGKHASGRNSGVLHAGVYYTPDTFKARFCVEGNRLLKEYCRERGLPLLETGKVIVAREEAEVSVLYELESRARANGIKVKLIDAAELKEIEPHAFTCEKALYSPDTAVVDPKKILQSLEREIISSGKATVSYSTAFRGLSKNGAVVSSKGRITFRKIVNAAGAYSDIVAHAFGLGGEYRILPFKGTYKRLHPEAHHLVNGSIYPVPDLRNPFLGVHFTRGVYGEVGIGPTAIPAFGRENYGILRGMGLECFNILYRDAVLLFTNPSFRSAALTEVRRYCGNTLLREAKRLVPEVKDKQIIASNKVGIRPQLVNWKKKTLVMDFVILEDGNAVHVLNAISPAFTSSAPFAKFVVEKLLS